MLFRSIITNKNKHRLLTNIHQLFPNITSTIYHHNTSTITTYSHQKQNISIITNKNKPHLFTNMPQLFPNIISPIYPHNTPTITNLIYLLTYISYFLKLHHLSTTTTHQHTNHYNYVLHINIDNFDTQHQQFKYTTLSN